jgi:hypothetical protein
MIPPPQLYNFFIGVEEKKRTTNKISATKYYYTTTTITTIATTLLKNTIIAQWPAIKNKEHNNKHTKSYVILRIFTIM